LFVLAICSYNEALVVRFEWNEKKRQQNIRKHEIDFVGSELLLKGCTLTVGNNRVEYGERRFITIGLLSRGVSRWSTLKPTKPSGLSRCGKRPSMSKQSDSKTSHPKTTEGRTDWERVDTLRDEDIDTPEHPEMTPEMFAKAVARKGLKPIPRKQQITLLPRH
jgi:uncharacterized DUF497 family protein